jgi:hypothetical protein
MIQIIGRIVMSNAQEAFAMTAVLFGLSFAGILLFWFAEKFRQSTINLSPMTISPGSDRQSDPRI